MKLLVDKLPKEPKECLFCLENKFNKDPDIYGESEYYSCILKDPEIESKLTYDDEPYYGTGKLDGVKSDILCCACDIKTCPYLKQYNAGIDFLKMITKD